MGRKSSYSRLACRASLSLPHRWWTIPFHLRPRASEQSQFPQLADRLAQHDWLDCRHCRRSLLWSYSHTRNRNLELSRLRPREMASNTDDVRLSSPSSGSQYHRR